MPPCVVKSRSCLGPTRDFSLDLTPLSALTALSCAGSRNVAGADRLSRPPLLFRTTNRHLNLIIPEVTFSRQNCRIVGENATTIDGCRSLDNYRNRPSKSGYGPCSSLWIPEFPSAPMPKIHFRPSRDPAVRHTAPRDLWTADFDL